MGRDIGVGGDGEDDGSNAGHVSRFGPENPARILPLVSGSGNRRLLSEWLEQQPDYEVVELEPETESFQEADIDLCILDQQTLENHVEELRSRKAAAAPTLIPYLLLFPEENPAIVGLDRGELADTVLRETIDEIVSLPLKKAELEWRVKALLRLRSQSLQSREEEKRLRRFKKAADSAGHAVYITNEAGTIEYVNEAFERITGYAASEAIGENPQLLNSGEMPTAYFEDLWESISNGETWEEEVINRRKNGEIYHAEQTIAPIAGPDGITAMVAVQSDITAHKRVQAELLEAKEQYQSLFNSIRDAILVADTERQIIDCNPAFTDLFGYELDEIEGKHTSYIYESQEEFEELGEAITGHIADPGFTYTVAYEKRSGQTFPGETNVYYLRNAADEVSGFIGVIRDISRREQRLQQLQKIDRVLQHNFKNDMNVILGNAHVVHEEAPPEFADKAARIIEAGSTLMETVQKEREITDFLSDPPETGSVSIGPLLDEIVTRISTDYRQADITKTCPGEVIVKANTALELAIEELVTNGVRHADTEEPTVEIEVVPSGDSVEIRVIDENPQIPEMEREILAGDLTETPLKHGSGMGLWLVSLIVDHSDGTVAVTENEPTGNIIAIHLPVP